MSPAVRNPPTAPPASTGSHPPEPGTGQQDGRRRGIRTVLISAVGLLSLAALAIGVLWSSLAPPEGTGTNQRPGTETVGPGSESLQAQGPGITGTISIAPELRTHVSETDTLFIIARKGEGSQGPPFAVKRIARPHFPLEFLLGQGDVMMAGASFDGDVHLSASLSKSWVAGASQPGDLEGDHPGQVPVGTRGVSIVIAHVR